ncbi:MAG TPA: anti-sigma factor [Nitrospira sp.]|nr:anti-sigma factor [Nitrospira sp.]
MNCEKIQAVVDGYVDGELSPVHNIEIEQHLRGCQACSQIYLDHQALQAALRAGSLYRTAPANLHRRILASLPLASTRTPIGIPMAWRRAALAASLALIAVFIWRLVPFVQGPGADELLIQEVTANHVRSLMVAHLVDIASSDRHVVKPWFTGKLDFAPFVPDLAEQGFPLIGGRLDYLNHRAVAAVVYKRREHVINVFIWPAAHAVSGETMPITHQGYHHLQWSDSSMVYWAVSDLNARELKDFVQLLQKQISH